MSLHGVVLIVDAVLARSMEMELSQLVGVVLGGEGAVGQDNFETGSQVLKLGAIGVGDVEMNSVGVGVVNVFSLNDNRRLVLALRAGGVLLVQAIPVRGTTSVGVGERVDVNCAISSTGHQRGAVQARGRCRSDERENGRDDLHFGRS